MACTMLFILILYVSAISEALGRDLNSRIIDVSPSFSNSGSRCNVALEVLGRGVNDAFDEYCSDASVPVISKEEYFILGNPNDRKLSLYSESWNTLVVVAGNKCSLKTYTSTYDETFSVTKPVSPEDCANIKQFMVQKLSQAQKPSKGNKSPSMGRSGPAALNPSNSRNDYPDYTPTQASPGKMSPSPSYRDTPRDMSGALRSSNSGKMLPPSPSYRDTPSDMSGALRSSNSGKGLSKSPSYNDKPTEPQTGSTIIKDPIPEAAYEDYFHSSVESTTTYGGSKITITIAGRGIYDVIEHKTSVKPNLKVRRSDSTLIIHDPNFDEIAVYSNEPKALVIVKKGSCFKRRYELLDEEHTKISYHEVGQKECTAIKEEMKNLPIGSSPMDQIWDHYNRDVEDYHREMNERFRMFNQRATGGYYG